MTKPNKRLRYRVNVHDTDDGGLGGGCEDRVYRFATKDEAKAFIYGLRVGNEHGCTARPLGWEV